MGNLNHMHSAAANGMHSHSHAQKKNKVNDVLTTCLEDRRTNRSNHVATYDNSHTGPKHLKIIEIAQQIIRSINPNDNDYSTTIQTLTRKRQISKLFLNIPTKFFITFFVA